MANTGSTATDDVAGKAVNKRYECLVGIRTKAVQRKGAWYWAHLEPVLIRNPETNLPKSVKLRCALCNTSFSASNPSRTASEHLKSGSCPNFSSALRPISAVPPLQLPHFASPSSHKHRKRSSRHTQHLVLSGGKEDLGALAMLEDCVKKLKSPKASPGPALSKGQVDSAFELLADWFFESCGSVSFSSISHPKFRAFLNQLGLPTLSWHEFLGVRLDSRFEEAKMESEARIREAMFFQVASDGWKSRNCGHDEENCVKFMVNLPNRMTVFQKAVCTGNAVPSNYAEEIMWESVTGVCGSFTHRCVGIVADKAKPLKNLEIQNQWMVNLSCQLQGFMSLIKDFVKELPLFKVVINNCSRIAHVFNSKSQVRNSFHKFQADDTGLPELITAPLRCDNLKNFGFVNAMLEDILRCSQVLHLVVLGDSYKEICKADPVVGEVAEIIQDVGFWNELEAVHSLVKLIRGMTEEIQAERPLVGQCLPLWEELKAKVKDWCAKFRVDEGPVEKIVEKRFKKNYHPAWSAAFILDPQYLTKDSSGKYIPPFKCLTYEQERDVDRLITRVVSREEAHTALMELMRWRSEGLEPLYAQAVQVKQRDPATGKMKLANPQASILVWETCLKEFRSLGKVAVRLLFLHATSCRLKCDWSLMRCVCARGNSGAGVDRAQKMIFVAAHAKLKRQEFLSEEEKDAEFFAKVRGEDDMLTEAFTDTSSM